MIDKDLVKLSSKGQLTIPKDVRDKQKLKTGDELLILYHKGRLILSKFDNIKVSGVKK